jgi:hypothetical protein
MPQAAHRVKRRRYQLVLLSGLVADHRVMRRRYQLVIWLNNNGLIILPFFIFGQSVLSLKVSPEAVPVIDLIVIAVTDF